MAFEFAFNPPQFGDEYNGVKMRQLAEEIERLHAQLTVEFDEPAAPVTTVESFEGRTGAVTAEQADYDSFFLTPAEADAAYSLIGHTHTSFSSPLRLIADISTGTPPTSEMPTANWIISDLDGNDDLATLGFNSSNDLEIINRMHGGGVSLLYEDSGGVQRVAIEQDPVGEVDANFADVVFLCAYDGVDAATAATDISTGGAGSPHAMTFVGNAQIDTSQSLFGTSALLLDGTGDWVIAPDSPDWHMAGDDFTIEIRARIAALPSLNVAYSFVSHYEPNSNRRSFGFDYFDNSSSPVIRFFYSTDGSVNTILTAPFTASANEWYEFSFSRIGSVGRLFEGGNQIGADFDMGTDVLHDSNHVLTIGALGRGGAGPTSPFNGWLEDLRITKGTGRYASNYTTISEQFPTDIGFNGLTIGSSQFRNRIQNSLFFRELVLAPNDVGGYGQTWVRDDGMLMYTNASGTDFVVAG